MHRIASIPARINIIGEHTDYAGGCSLAFAAPQRLILEATSIDEGFEGENTVVLLWKEAKGWPASLIVTSNIPIGSGMSSSAALCLAIVLCIHKDIDPFEACLEAQRIEHAVLKTECRLFFPFFVVGPQVQNALEERSDDANNAITTHKETVCSSNFCSNYVLCTIICSSAQM